MLIEVTQDDIDNGAKGDPDECPVALAASRAFGINCGASVGVIFINHIDAYQEFVPPDIADQFMMDFDSGWPVHPISFTIGEP